MRYKVFALVFVLFTGAIVAEAATKRALVFGLGKQADASWAKIHGDNDVDYVVKMLQKMGYTDIRTLKNEQATKQAMVQAFQQLARHCHKGDEVYVHYSGHGQLMTDLDGDESLKWEGRHAQWDEAWVPYDAYMTYCAEDHGEKHLSDDEVALLLQAIRQRIGQKGELVVVVDACHSGDATCGPDDDEPVRGIDTKFNIPRQLDTPQTKQPVAEQWRTISACKPYQLCTEIKEPQVGKLTYALYKLGEVAMKKSNEELEHILTLFMEQHKSRLTQTPMVTGKK